MNKVLSFIPIPRGKCQLLEDLYLMKISILSDLVSSSEKKICQLVVEFPI